MTLIDTHTHLYLPEFDNGGDDAVRRAIDAGVTHMVFPNVDVEGADAMMELAARWPGHVYTAMGLHPTEVCEHWKDDLGTLMDRLIADGTHVAVGEVGMDLYWDRTYRLQQMEVLDIQARKAVELDLPLIIHCRDGLDETLEVLEGVPGVRGVMHSFGGTADDVEAVRRRIGDFYFGINGIVTFKNSRLREVLPAIGADRMLLETDSPYLAPVPKRGKRNESAYMVYTAACVADALGMPLERLAEITTASARSLFNI